LGKTLKESFDDIINSKTNIETRTQLVTKFLTFVQQNKILLNIYTRTAGNLQNVVITNINAIRTQEFYNIITVDLSFKVISFAETQVVSINTNSYLGRVKQMVSDAEIANKTEGEDVSSPSILYAAKEKIAKQLFSRK